MSGKFLLDTNIVIAIFSNDLSVNKELAKADDLTLVSRYDHFKEIDGLLLVEW